MIAPKREERGTTNWSIRNVTSITRSSFGDQRNCPRKPLLVQSDLVPDSDLFSLGFYFRFKTIAVSYMKPCQVIYVVYDVTRRATFATLDSWIEKIKEQKEERKNDRSREMLANRGAGELEAEEEEDEGEGKRVDPADYYRIIIVGAKGQHRILLFFFSLFILVGGTESIFETMGSVILGVGFGGSHGFTFSFSALSFSFWFSLLSSGS